MKIMDCPLIVGKFSCLLSASVFTLALPLHVQATTFEGVFKGFLNCKHKNVYIDVFTNKPATPYFEERGLNPYKVEKELAYYHVNERLYGLPIDEIAIPSGTYAVHELYVNLPINQARKILRRKLGSDFKKNYKSDNGLTPELLMDRRRPNRSIFSCQDIDSGI